MLADEVVRQDECVPEMLVTPPMDVAKRMLVSRQGCEYVHFLSLRRLPLVR